MAFEKAPFQPGEQNPKSEKERKKEEKARRKRENKRGKEGVEGEEEEEKIGSKLVLFFVTLLIIAIWLGIIADQE